MILQVRITLKVSPIGLYNFVKKSFRHLMVLQCYSNIKMINLGIQFLRDCPIEPNIPIYMVVGGTIGSVKMGQCLWDQLHTRHVDPSSSDHSSIAAKVASVRFN